MESYNPNGIWKSRGVRGSAGESDPQITVPEKPAVHPTKEVAPPGENSTGPWFMWVGIVAGVVLIVGLALYYFLRPGPAPMASLTVTPPNKILIGDPFVLMVSVTNPSLEDIHDAVLTLKLPDNVVGVGQPAGSGTVTWRVGDLPAGSAVNETSTFIVTSGPQSVATVMAQLSYTAAASSVQSSVSQGEGLVIGAPAVALTVGAPQSAVAGSGVNLTLNYANAADDAFGDVHLMLSVPPAFTFETSSVKVSPTDNGILNWDIGALAPGATGTVTAYGTMDGSGSSTYAFAGSVGVGIGGQTYTMAGPTANIDLIPAPVSLTVLVNNTSTHIAVPNEPLIYTLKYTNNATVALKGVTIRAKLTGAMFDLSSIQTDGSFSSLTNTVTWSPSSAPALTSLAPGASGMVTFHVRTLSAFPITHATDKNFTLQVQGVLTSPTVLPGVAAVSTISAGNLTIPIAGGINIIVRGYRYEVNKKIVNSGPYPPTVNQPTSYTIHWIVSDTSDDLQNVTVSAPLPTGVSFTGQVISNVSTTPQYDPTTGMVTWQIPALPATAGIALPAPEAIFQVEKTPAINEVGQPALLLGATTIQANDAFTGQALRASAATVTTNLPYDPAAAKIQNGSVKNGT